MDDRPHFTTVPWLLERHALQSRRCGHHIVLDSIHVGYTQIPSTGTRVDSPATTILSSFGKVAAKLYSVHYYAYTQDR